MDVVGAACLSLWSWIIRSQTALWQVGDLFCFLFLQETCKCLKSNGNLLAVFMGGQAVISHEKCLHCRQQLYCCTDAMLKLSSAPLIYGLSEHFLGFLDSVDSFKSDWTFGFIFIVTDMLVLLGVSDPPLACDTCLKSYMHAIRLILRLHKWTNDITVVMYILYAIYKLDLWLPYNHTRYTVPGIEVVSHSCFFCLVTGKK